MDMTVTVEIDKGFVLFQDGKRVTTFPVSVGDKRRIRYDDVPVWLAEAYRLGYTEGCSACEAAIAVLRDKAQSP